MALCAQDELDWIAFGATMGPFSSLSKYLFIENVARASDELESQSIEQQQSNYGNEKTREEKLW